MGSRWGIGDYGSRTRGVLIEANHQRWWCPTYTASNLYSPGEGVPTTGYIIKCGMWRCDSYVAWTHYAGGGYANLLSGVLLPKNIFYAFPYSNVNYTPETVQAPLLTSTDKDFSSLTADEINTMPFEEFEMIADIPMELETPTHIQAEWRFAKDTQVNEVKRGIFIDRITLSNEQNVVPKFLDLYKKENSPEIKEKIIQATVIYYQNHRDVIKDSSDFILLKDFYNKLLSTNVTPRADDLATLGFIDISTVDEIINNQDKLNKKIDSIDSFSRLRVHLQLTHKSKELEKIYLKKAIQLLQKENSYHLDEMFFGLSAMAYGNYQKDSQDLIKQFVKLRRDNYRMPTLSQSSDPYSVAALHSLNDLKKAIK